MSDTDTAWTTGFGTTPARKSSAFINPGVYRVQLTSIVKQTSRNPKTKGHVLVIVEGRILDVVARYDAAGHPSNPAKKGWAASNVAGESVASINNFTKQGETAMANVKGLLLACLQARAQAAGKPPPQEADLTAAQWEQTLTAATSGAGTLFAGVELICYASRTVTKADEAFTPLRWEPVQPAAAS